MRCQICNAILVGSELRKKNKITREFEDICTECTQTDLEYQASGYGVEYTDEEYLDSLYENPLEDEEE